MGTIKTTNIETITGSGTLTIGQSGETISVPTGATLTVPSGGLSGQNYPAFEAYGSADQTGVADNVFTKVQYNTEVFDTDSMYDNSTNYRFTPTVAGKYFVYAGLNLVSEGAYKIFSSNISIYKNGSAYKSKAQTEQQSSNFPNARSYFIGANIEFNGSTDYVEIFAKSNVTSGTVEIEIDPIKGIFGAYRIGD
jgi:hypothetical protein